MQGLMGSFLMGKGSFGEVLNGVGVVGVGGIFQF